MRMFRKVMALILILILLSVLTISIHGTGVFKDIDWPWKESEEVAEKISYQGLMLGYGDGKFCPNETLTNRQALIVFSRLMTDNVDLLPKSDEELMEYIKEIVLQYRVSLPSDLVYSKSDWETVWKDILTNKTVFEKIDEDKYSVVLIPGYFKIYLNEKGYFLFKKGMIPTQIEFYSPFTRIDNLSEETLNQPITKGFVMELITIYDMKRNLTDYSIREIGIKKNRVENLLTTILIEQTTKRVEEDWTILDINKYNYVSMSYGGAMQYGILRGIIQPENTLEDMNRPIKRIEYAVMIDRVNKYNDVDTLKSTLDKFLEKGNIDVFDIYLNR